MDASLVKLYQLFPDCKLFHSNEPALLCSLQDNETQIEPSRETLNFASLHVPPFITNFPLNDGSLICGAILSITKIWACKGNIA